MKDMATLPYATPASSRIPEAEWLWIRDRIPKGQRALWCRHDDGTETVTYRTGASDDRVSHIVVRTDGVYEIKDGARRLVGRGRNLRDAVLRAYTIRIV